MNYLKSIVWGIFAALGALVLELAFSVFFPEIQPANNVFQTTIYFLAIAATIEEFCKLSVIASTTRQFAEKKRVIANSLLIGFGFAATESFFTWSNEIFSRNDLYHGIIGLFFVHMITALNIGAFIARFRFNLSLWMMLWPFASAIAIHLAYNLILISRLKTEAAIVFAALSILNLSLLLFKTQLKAPPMTEKK